MNIYHPQTKFAKVMLSQVLVCPQGISFQEDLCLGVSVQGGLHPADLCLGVSVHRGSLSTGGLCPLGVSVGGLCPGGLCWGSLSTGGLCLGVSVQGDLYPGGVCLGGLCPEGISVKRSLSWGSLSRRPPYGNVQAVRILLECILVRTMHRAMSLSD